METDGKHEMHIDTPFDSTDTPGVKKRRFLKVLVVDDILYVVKSISRILQAEGFFVLTARSGREALQKFKEYSPDLVTVDQKLPDMTGQQLVEIIRKEENADAVKIIPLNVCW